VWGTDVDTRTRLTLKLLQLRNMLLSPTRRTYCESIIDKLSSRPLCPAFIVSY
jgi:hypothetical protein